MAVELTRKAVVQLSNDIKRQIQVFKVDGSKDTISRLQSADRFAPNKDITSYVTSTHQRNRYNDINRFYAVMEKAPKFWNKRFIYVSDSDEILNDRIAEAAAMAVKIVYTKTAAYPVVGPTRIPRTGKLLDSIRTYVNSEPEFSFGSAIRNSEGSALFELTNRAEYGSTAEARAVYVTRQQGLIFYAANRVQTKFPDLGVMFRFAKAEDFELPHIYNVPVLTIGSKDDVHGPWRRPGENIRRLAKKRRAQAGAAERIRRIIDGG